MGSGEIEPHDDAYVVLMTFSYDSSQHVGFHVRIRVLAVELGWIECHDTAGVDDESICGEVNEIRDERVGVEAGFVGWEICLDDAEVVGFPPGDGVGP